MFMFRGMKARKAEFALEQKAAKRLRQLFQHEEELANEGFPPSLREGFGVAALHSDEESEDEIGEDGASLKVCKPIPVPIRSRLVSCDLLFKRSFNETDGFFFFSQMQQLIQRADEYIEEERASSDKSLLRYIRRSRQPYKGDLAFAPRPPKNKVHRWQVDPAYLKAFCASGHSDADLGLLEDPSDTAAAVVRSSLPSQQVEIDSEHNPAPPVDLGYDLSALDPTLD